MKMSLLNRVINDIDAVWRKLNKLGKRGKKLANFWGIFVDEVMCVLEKKLNIRPR